jgi:FkbM family methyltransferase
MRSLKLITSHKIRTLRDRPDFRKNPARAVVRRLLWRLRWIFSQRPWSLELGQGLQILAPKGGAGALIYYLGYSEPETANFILQFLKPGMTFWDVGAHIGEYSLLASRVVGPTGHIESFEPQSDIFALLAASIRRNHLTNICPYQTAVADTIGARLLTVFEEPSLAHLSLAEGPGVPITTTTLDCVFRQSGRTPDLVKVDVEGAEMLVLLGARDLLSLPAETAPVWVMEHSPENCARFGYPADDLLAQFRDHGYNCHWLASGGGLWPSDKPNPWITSGNLVASKREIML